MGACYQYANYTKRERFSVAALGGGMKLDSVGHTLASRALHLMLVELPGAPPAGHREGLGRWAGDSIRLVADDHMPDYEQFKAEFTDIEANAILLVFRHDGFDRLAAAAEQETGLFMELCHLAATRQSLELEPLMKRKFGKQFLKEYKKLCEERRLFQPKDAIPAPGG